MIPLLYKKDGTTKIGELTNCIECLVEEERNGIFEVSIVYPTTDSIFNSLEEENIIICDANDTLKAQKFRIYMTRKLMSNKIEVYARHISFDLAYDYIDNIDITNQSCEYALNTIFRNSQFSTHYRGYSDIINAQNYKISMSNCIEAIAGKEGSIIDTFGTGAEILRDNTNIHVLNKRGHDNEVSIEYAKNLTGFELEEDYSDLVTRINAYAKYTNSETNEEVLVEAKSIDSPLITNYSHPYVAYIDYSDKFENEEIPTKEKLIELAKKEYSINNKDKPKQNYKIEFVPLSKCVGYEDLEDKISLCDTVTIKDTRYGIDTKSKVIRTVFDVLKNRYDSMELGEPKTTLGDIIGGSGEDGVVGPPGPQGPPGADGNIGDFPDSLPSTPILSYKLYGFANIELSWTFENKVYYQYELYASKTKDFIPNVFDIIHQGQTSSFLFQAKPDETWYFRCCAINTHGNRTEFSSQIAVTTTKIDDLSNYVANMAIGDALIGELNLGRGWFGQLRGNYIDAKQLSVTDGNGKRTLDIDSFGNVALDVTSLKISNKAVATEEFATSKSDAAYNASLDQSKNYTDAQINVVNGQIDLKVAKGDVVNQINLSSEGAKIKADKIQLEGTVTTGENGKRIKLENSDYSVIDNDVVKAFFGFKSFGESYDKYLVPKLYMSYNGFSPVSEKAYFGMSAYAGGGNNPEGNAESYHDMSYRCKNEWFADWSNIKMYNTGVIRLAPVTDLEITTNNYKGVYYGNEERLLAKFTTNDYSEFNSNLQIGAINNTSNGNGLVLADTHNSDWNNWAMLQLHVDSSGGKYFRPLNNYKNDIELGSLNFPFKKLTVSSTLSSQGIVVNEVNVLSSEISSNDIINNIEFISTYSQDESLIMDVTNIVNTDYVEVSEDGQAYMNETEMIKLLLKEVKQLKDEIEVLKGGA